MVSKRNKRRSGKRLPKAVSAEARFAQAQQALEGGRFRDAIAQFKALAKAGDNPQYRDGLAAAYRGRARESTLR